MSLETNVVSLERKRAQIKEAILEEVHRPCPDSLRLTTLKKQNLKLKEEIEHLSCSKTTETT